MRRSFFKKLSFALLVLMWIGWAALIYTSPKEWIELTGLFIVLTLVYGLKMWTTIRAADNEKSFADEIEDNK